MLEEHFAGRHEMAPLEQSQVGTGLFPDQRELEAGC